MKKITAFMLSASMVLATVPVMADTTATATSTFNGLVGVPVTADIPLTVTGELTQADITVSPETAFTLTGSDSDYKIDFTEDMLAGNEYTITAGASTIKYTTAYGMETPLASISDGTPNGAGRTANFTSSTAAFTVKVNFKDNDSGKKTVPDKCGVYFSNVVDGASKGNVGFRFEKSGDNDGLLVDYMRHNGSAWVGPAGSKVNWTDFWNSEVYVTFKDNKATAFVVSQDGTVTAGPTYSWAGQSENKDREFDSVRIDSIQYGIVVGNQVDDPNEKPALSEATSTFNNLVGVPATASIPLTFESNAALTKEDVTITPAVDFTVEGSGTAWSIKPATAFAYGTEYTVAVGESTIKFTTAYGTDAAKIPTNTGSGAGRTKTFDKTKNLTVKIDFMKYTELPGSKWIKLKDDSNTKMGVLVSNDGTNITLGMHRWDTKDNAWKGPGGATVKCNGDFTDVAYMTVKNNVATIFVVAADGTVRYETKWDFSGSTIKDAEFNTVEIDSILYGVEVGTSTGSGEESKPTQPTASETPVDPSVTMTSTFNGVVGIPANGNIPLTFSDNVTLTKSDVTVSPAFDFELAGSDKAWTIKPTDKVKYGTEYTVTVGKYGTVKYTTAFLTNAAKVPTGSQGDARKVTFPETNEFTMMIEFVGGNGMPSNKTIALSHNGTKNMGIQVTNDGTDITLGLLRFNGTSFVGPAVDRAKCSSDFTDVAYVTVKNNKARIDVVKSDGTVTIGKTWDFSSSTIGNTKFDKAEIDSIVYGIEIGNTVGDKPESSEKPSASPSASPEPTEDPDLKPAVECSVNGKEFVPTNVSIPLKFNKTFGLNKNDVTITADGKPVTNFTLSTKDDKNYLITFTGGLTERAEYSITINAEGIDKTPITFTTAYTTNKESLTVCYDGNRVPLSRVTDQLTIYGEITEATYSVGSNKYITLYDTTDPSYDEKTNISSKYVKIWMRRQQDTMSGYGISMFIRNGAEDKEHEFTLIPQGEIPLNNTSPIITLKGNKLYIYTINADLSVTSYDVETPDLNTYIPNFKVGAVGGNGTSYLKIHTGYGDELKAELTSTGAKKDDTVKFTFSTDVAEYPKTANITDGKTTVAAAVTVDGKVATLTLPSDLAYSTIYSADLSGFKDRMGESAGTVKFETSAAPAMVVPGKVTATIGGSETTSIKAGELSITLPVTKTDSIPTEFTKVDMMVGLYKKVDGKTYLVSMTKLGSADLTTDSTINSVGTVTVPQAAAGEEYFVKIFVYPQTGGAYSLIPSQTIK